ncbi:MAG: mannose-1-phosphate guanylyltransferase/mannose-6-phosphate isomerase [Pseudomonadota bacterium]|nr:mannose-1-phosphate guanylyltransferase/mannose-6-phosphate isomerase [Gammaproteobacteria bacterium]MBJ54345.1 mannose-1-phosphate guanylyltransferase/mannose-6-phosphate isomerase [Gammaproteobacteria bacterium]MEC8860386.1 mannose-1-phosphate guanylyltransferase/mannose-6-phosphate isomerase [Pseudomonadota bacterium]HBN15031.1 mannose-1-phosphate guanylyltransferase/mannose-6-phosphate isomerase [Pseudohongiella sp.]|tara:strand:+ start:1168 stop:2619 length:1452 start_codon:yes stop_codon:yes gene_type:complete
MIIPVILAGGTGSRLWPLSRQLNPKQFVDIATHEGDLTLFQATLSRLQGLADLASPIVICNEEHRFLVAEQLRQLAEHEVPGAAQASLLLEPAGRNTAPALTLAALLAQQQAGPDDVMLVLPADHLIADVAAFHECVLIGQVQAAAGSLVTFGITPSYPETGYGYIQAGAALAASNDRACQVARFVEKPDIATARGYLEAGDYFWNSGMFMMTATTWLQEAGKFAPAITEACTRAFETLTRDGDFIRIDEKRFSESPSDSIDYAVMEKTPLAAVVPMKAGWSDLGAWNALWETSTSRDEQNNVRSGDVYLQQVSNSYVHAGSRFVAAVGMDHAVIVETADAVLVANKDQVQDVKGIVQWLTQQQRSEAVSHTLVYRPWGSYECLSSGPGFQVKRIRVRPGAALSLQMHQHRAEHWVVISGSATVTCDERKFVMQANESTFIPLGSKHRLQNEGTDWVELIEVQTGSYLGEDDIVRFDDVYGRS